MSGAAALAGKASLRSGAGLVQLAVPAPCLATVAVFEPSYMTAPLAADEAGRIDVAARERIVELADAATVVACGPGLGRSAGLNQLVGWLYRELPKPLVVDADALNALAEPPNDLAVHKAPRIITPHPGEFARLTGIDAQEVQRNRDGMATGGTGDVLTGVIAGLLAQGLAPFDAARLAPHVHGLAGDLAAAELGQVSLIASDLLNWLPQAFRAVSA
jgi:NAD(P)H-hydrate epimerase